MSEKRMGWAVCFMTTSDPPLPGIVLAIFKEKKKAIQWQSNRPGTAAERAGIYKVSWVEAVRRIRAYVYERDESRCVRCGKLVTFEQMHMHERKARGKGGEISIENSETRCSDCHVGPRGAHGDRRPQFGKGRLTGR